MKQLFSELLVFLLHETENYLLVVNQASATSGEEKHHPYVKLMKLQATLGVQN